MSGRLSGRVSLLTGASSGIGRASAIRFAQEGSDLVITDVNVDGLEETRALAEEAGVRVVAQAADLAMVSDIRAVAASAEEQFGRLDIVANIAGIHSGAGAETCSEDEWDRVHTVNAKAPFFVIQSALPLLKRGGAIVNVSSLSGIVGVDSQSVYCSSKGAVVALTRGLAFDLAPDIRVNCICPGAVDTAMPGTFLANFSPEEQEKLKEGWFARQLLKRFAAPEEIADSVLFLASDESSFMTGTIMPVDAGWTAW